jgi:hypothetical protein
LWESIPDAKLMLLFGDPRNHLLISFNAFISQAPFFHPGFAAIQTFIFVVLSIYKRHWPDVW